jgi:hypothetical protein
VTAFIIVRLVDEFVFVVGVTKTWATERLAKTGRTSLYATTRVMDAPWGSAAVTTGKVDDPGLAVPLIAPSDRLEEIVTDADRIGPAADVFRHFSVAIWANGHLGPS